jgi:cell wall assembly regulator SMI1
MLSRSLLASLADRWETQAAPIAQDLRPGLEPRAIEEVTSPFAIRLPAEARLWWEWHDGTWQTLTSHALGLDLAYLPLAMAAERYAKERDAAAQAVDEGIDPSELWQPGWFPLASGGDGRVMACDCDITEGAPTPIHYVHWEKAGDDSHQPVAPSLGVVVSWWIEAIDSGAWRYDGDAARWESRPDLLPNPALELTGLV